MRHRRDAERRRLGRDVQRPRGLAARRRRARGHATADELVAQYAEAWGEPLADLAWFRALAAYKFAIIAGFNLGLHRRGKRPDPLWERIGESIASLQARALELLGG